jgi:predicted transcriptional regulator
MSIPSPEEIESLTLDAKVGLAVRLRGEGMPPNQIAAVFGVTPRTIYNWFSKYRDDYIQELEQLKHIDVFTEQLQSLQEYEQKILRVATKLGFDSDEPVDPKTKIKGKLGDWVNLMKLAASVRDQQVKLHQFCGTVPRQPERIYHTISESSCKNGENKDDISKLGREELEKLTLRRLQEQLVL